MRRLGVLLALASPGCLQPEVDRITDPVAKAAYHCRYVLERALATDAERSPDGVLRKRIADFVEPTTTRTGDVVRFTWPQGAVVVRRTGARHGGDCVMDIADGQQLVVSANLDGRPLHAGFRF